MSTQAGEPVSGKRWVISLIASIAGIYFVLLAAYSIRTLAAPRHPPRAYEVIFAIASAYLAFRGIRAAIFCKPHDESLVSALRAGMFGAFVGLLALISVYLMFGVSIHLFFAHSLGLHGSQVSTNLLLFAFVVTGFAAGFVLGAGPLHRTR